MQYDSARFFAHAKSTHYVRSGFGAIEKLCHHVGSEFVARAAICAIDRRGREALAANEHPVFDRYALHESRRYS